MLNVNGVAINFDGQNLFSNVNLQFLPGNCYGIIGANGAGKSTFLRILSGDLEPSKGEVTFDPKYRMSVLKQDHFAYEDQTIFDTIMQGNARLYEIAQEKDALYAKPDFDEEDGNRAAELEAEFSELNGWDAETEAAKLMQGLGLDSNDMYNTMSTLNQTEKVKVLLARALFGQPDMILLDEPTNGLDIPSKSQFRRVVARSMTEGRTLVISTHQVRDIDTLLDHVVMLDGSRVLLNRPTADICAALRFDEVPVGSAATDALYAQPSPGGQQVVRRNDGTAETPLNLELLFNAMLDRPGLAAEIFPEP